MSTLLMFTNKQNVYGGKTLSGRKGKFASDGRRAVSCRFYSPNGTEGALMKCFKDSFWTIVSHRRKKAKT